MYWILVLYSRTAPANVTLPLKCLTKLPVPFYSHIDYSAKQAKITKKSRK